MKNYPIGKIKMYEKNAKKHPENQIKKIADSISEFGFNQPIVIDQNDEIIVGHGRYLAAKKMGLKEVPIVRKENLTEEQVKAYRLADNKLNESDWDMDLVFDELKGLSDEMVQLSGFDMSYLEVEEDDFNADEEYEKIIEPKTKVGDVYQLGDHRIICGDSTDVSVYEKLMGNEKAQLIFTDPPYNVDYQSSAGNSYAGGKYGDGNKIFNDNKSDSDFMEFISVMTANCFLFSDEKASMYMWYASKNHEFFKKGLIAGGFKYLQDVIWVKDRFVFSMGCLFHRAYEPCMIGIKDNKYQKNKEFSNIQDIWDIKKDELAEMVDVWYVNRDNTTEYVHPTQKPLRLCEIALRRSTFNGDIVLDAFGGSGSTMMACDQMARKARLIELDPKYVDVIIKRYEDYTGKKAEKIEQK
jgi:site-specific DNA-methyltransferase (adenine-specific)